jgi:hypothetical protein
VKEISMRRFLGVAALLSLAVPTLFAATPPPASSGTVVIQFKDGHRQSFNLADITRIELPSELGGDIETGSANAIAPSRGRFLGKWVVGDGNGGDFTIRLEENGDAYRSIGDVHGKWVYVRGEAQITWDDGAQDAIRRAGTVFEKYAYSQGKQFTDRPDNVTHAHNTTPHPI